MKLLEQEMAQYQPLIDSGCSNKLKFFLCGAYMPFCVPGTSQVTGDVIGYFSIIFMLAKSIISVSNDSTVA